MTSAWTVFRKELIDALRDRRTLVMVILSSVLMGPVLLVALSSLVGTLERQAESREILAVGIEHAPSLRNFIERQTYTVRGAPADYRQQILDSKLGEAVLVIPADFENRLAQGRVADVELFFSSANTRTLASVPRIARLLQGFSSERSALHLLVRGVAPALVNAISMQERDVANTAARGARFTGLIPVFLMLAMLYGLLAAAVDTTAGERERGSLEPLLTTPASRWSLVLGKWAAVASMGLMVAVLSVASFLPAQWLLRSDTLQAMFRFGVREAALLLALLLPLAAALAAVMMAVAIRCKTFKEAQTNNTVVMLTVSLLPLFQQFNQSGEQPWHLAMPVLAQTVLMNRVLKDEAIAMTDLLMPFAACAIVMALAGWLLARTLDRAALK